MRVETSKPALTVLPGFSSLPYLGVFTPFVDRGLLVMLPPPELEALFSF